MNDQNEKKRNILKAALIAVGAFFAAIITGIMLLYKRSIKKVREQDELNKHNMMEIITLGIHKAVIKEETDNAYLSCLLGRNKIVFDTAPVKDVLIDVCGVFSTITVVVPETAKVVCDVELTDGKLCEELPADENQEGTPTVTITGRMICSTINVERE